MKKFLFLLIFVLSFSANAKPALSSPVSFDLRQISVNEVITFIYSEAFNSNFVIDPEVLDDSRLVTFRFNGNNNNLKPFVISFLDSLGYSIKVKSNVDYISKKIPLVIEPLIEVLPDQIVSIYRSKFRDSSYLVRILSPLFTGEFLSKKTISLPDGSGLKTPSSPSSASALLQQDSDVLIFKGTQKETDLLFSLIPQLDVSSGEVFVRALIYEVSSSKIDGSAFKLFSSLLSSKLGISINSDASILGNSISLNVGGLDAIVGALATDNRFRSITQPRMRVRSGQTSKLLVGQDVPVLGAVSFQQSGGSVRSVEYRSAGTILSITPTVRESIIDIDVNQQLSNFVRTDTGVDDSPTLIKREFSTSLSMRHGDVVLLGGLNESKVANTSRSSPLLPWSTSRQDDDSSVDVLVILQVEKIP